MDKRDRRSGDSEPSPASAMTHLGRGGKRAIETRPDCTLRGRFAVHGHNPAAARRLASHRRHAHTADAQVEKHHMHMHIRMHIRMHMHIEVRLQGVPNAPQLRYLLAVPMVIN